MLVSPIIVFREVLEASLIVGIVLATNGVLGQVGKAMHALVGYAAPPSEIQFAAWVMTLVGLVLLSRLAQGKWGRSVAAAGAIACVLAIPGLARAADEPMELILRNHRFEPARLEVPANAKFRLKVINADETPDEFDSPDLNREKVIPGGRTAIIALGPLKPGDYKFMGEFHRDTAQGVLVAK